MGAASAAAVAGKARGPPLVLEIPRHLLDISPSRRAGGDIGNPRGAGGAVGAASAAAVAGKAAAASIENS